MAQQPSMGQALLIIEASRLYSDTPHSIWLPWTSDWPDAETSTWHHTPLTRDRHEPGGIRTRSHSKTAPANPLLRPRGHWDRLVRHRVISFISFHHSIPTFNAPPPALHITIAFPTNATPFDSLFPTNGLCLLFHTLYPCPIHMSVSVWQILPFPLSPPSIHAMGETYPCCVYKSPLLSRAVPSSTGEFANDTVIRKPRTKNFVLRKSTY
jgi:hypothetical protein